MVLKTHLEQFREPLKVPPVGQPKNFFSKSVKHNYSDWFTILKAIDAESPIVIFWGDNQYSLCVPEKKETGNIKYLYRLQ